MNKIRLAERREHLIAQAAAQRATLARNIEPWRVPLARVDQGLNLLRSIKRHPAWIVGGVVLFAALKPVRVVKWLQRGWVAWQVVHRLRGG
jgi:hypothetical protein